VLGKCHDGDGRASGNVTCKRMFAIQLLVACLRIRSCSSCTAVKTAFQDPHGGSMCDTMVVFEDVSDLDDNDANEQDKQHLRFAPT
jgi:hypothetical protein